MITNKRIPLSYPFSLVKWDVLFTLIFSTGIHLLGKHIVHWDLPIAIAAFLGTAIALILSFKLSQSYDRWWEARKIWGAIVNDSRTLVTQLLAFNTHDFKTTKKLAYRQIGWCYSLGQSLRKLDSIKGLRKYVSENELQSLRNLQNIPLALLKEHSLDIANLLKEGKINTYQQTQLDATVVRLNASMGMAERIKNTYFPKPYRLTLQFFIYLFLVILSLSLTELESFIEIPLLMVIALPFFLLEKIAFRIQDPFENRPMDTPVTAIARTIEINLRQLIEDEDVPEPLNSNTFYIL
ncbi:bestrophin family protein [Flagellimonas sp.]|uniref:bestrophin family protein n=1 Tax=Flagellimonas sp. TaxID=2058762 RepID=UPI003B5002B0